MASITIESYKVFNACVECIEHYEKFWKDMEVTEDGESLLSVTEEERKFKLMSLLHMSKYSSTTIDVDNYEFVLIAEYLDV